MREPCMACGEETAAGSPFYADRRRVQRGDGTVLFLCSDCIARATSGQRVGLTDEQARRLDEGAAMFGVWVTSPH